MARMPAADWLGEHSPKRRMVRHDIVCVHTIVGYAPAHAAHFSVKGDGTILQSRDTDFQSAANLNGNPRIIAIENEDHGPRFRPWAGSDVPPLTPEQVESNARILAWAHKTHGVPLELCPDSRPGSRGLAYHRQGVDGNFTRYRGRVDRGETWTEHFGKVCPGDSRIGQLPDILARARILAGYGPTPAQEDDMPNPRDFLDEPLNKHEPKGRPATRGLTVGESLSLIPIIAKQIGGEAAAVLEQMQSSPAKKES